MSLIADIRTHVLDPKYPLTSVLREATVLARKLRSQELAAWVRSELDGYGNRSDVPGYRKFEAQSVGSGQNFAWRVNNVPIPTYILPKNIRKHVDDGKIGGGVGELESLLESKKATYHRPWEDSLIAYYNSLPEVNLTLVNAHVVVPRGVLVHVLETVRTKLLEFVLEIEDLNPGARDIPSLEMVPPAITHQIFDRVIMNNRHYHGDVQNVQGVYGGNVATGQARISSSSASYTSVAEARTAFEALKTNLNDVATADRETVRASIDLLIAAIEDSDIPKSRIVAAAETVAGASDRLKRGLRDLSVGMAGSLASTGLWEGIRYAIGNG